jgi:nucleotide-binding universal stress UspA family protein
MYNKILIPLDGSKTAEKVLPYARYLAGKFKIPVELLPQSTSPKWRRTWPQKKRVFSIP